MDWYIDDVRDGRFSQMTADTDAVWLTNRKARIGISDIYKPVGMKKQSEARSAAYVSFQMFVILTLYFSSSIAKTKQSIVYREGGQNDTSSLYNYPLL